MNLVLVLGLTLTLPRVQARYIHLVCLENQETIKGRITVQSLSIAVVLRGSQCFNLITVLLGK